MLTDEEVKRIDAEYAALPGTKPDGYSWTLLTKVADHRTWLREQFLAWRQQGMQHTRVTHKEDDGTLWVEVWREIPRKEAPFDPPYTYGAP